MNYHKLRNLELGPSSPIRLTQKKSDKKLDLESTPGFRLALLLNIVNTKKSIMTTIEVVLKQTGLSWLTLFASTGTLICCALPIILVTLGLGATVAAFTSSFPLLVTIAQLGCGALAPRGVLVLPHPNRPIAFCSSREHSGTCPGNAYNGKNTFPHRRSPGRRPHPLAFPPGKQGTQSIPSFPGGVSQGRP